GPGRSQRGTAYAGAMEAALDWFGCATFRLTVGKLVIFLDAYLARAPSAPQPELLPEDVEHADWIVVGHSHFDHLYGAERIARRTGAKILGSHETVRIMEAHGVPVDRMIALSGGERPGAARRRRRARVSL